jgi:hypothetical protein
MDYTTEQPKYNSSLPTNDQSNISNLAKLAMPKDEIVPKDLKKSFLDVSKNFKSKVANLMSSEKNEVLETSENVKNQVLGTAKDVKSNIANLAMLKDVKNQVLETSDNIKNEVLETAKDVKSNIANLALLKDEKHNPITFINKDCDKDDGNFVYNTLCNDITLKKKFNTNGINDVKEINESIKQINHALLNNKLEFKNEKLATFVNSNADIFKKEKYIKSPEQNKEIMERSLDLLQSKKLLLKKISIYNNDTEKVNYNDQKLNVIYKSMKNDRPMNAKESEVWYETKKGMLNKLKYFGAVLLGINNFNKYNITSAQEAFKSELIIMKVGLTVFLLILYVSYHINYDKPTVVGDPLCSVEIYNVDDNGNHRKRYDGGDASDNFRICPATNTLLSKTSKRMELLDDDMPYNRKYNIVSDGVGIRKYNKFTKYSEHFANEQVGDITKEYKKPTIKEIRGPLVLTPSVAVLSFIMMYLGRYKSSEWVEIISEHLVGMILIFIILFLFELAKEGSGAGRWLEKNSKDSVYKRLDNANIPGSANATGPLGGKSSGDKEGVAAFFALPKYGDPFINNMAMCTFVIIGVYLVFIMLRLASLSSLGWEYFAPGTEGNIPWWHFILEMIFVVLVNALTQPVGEMIRESDYSFKSFKHSMSKSSLFFLIFVLGGTMLHVSFQSIGFLGYDRS